MLFENLLQRIIGWLAPSPHYPVKMANSGLAIHLTPNGIDPETLRLLTPQDLEVLARDFCHTCHTNGHGANSACVDCSPVRFFAAAALTTRLRNEEVSS